MAELPEVSVSKVGRWLHGSMDREAKAKARGTKPRKSYKENVRAAKARAEWYAKDRRL
jgi:hypothetical protein